MISKKSIRKSIKYLPAPATKKYSPMRFLRHTFKKTHLYPKTLWIRTPVIPNATDTVENIQGIGDFIQANLEGAVDRWELCAFNNLCRDKYKRLGMDWSFADQDLAEKSWMEELTRVAKSRVTPSIVCWSGATKLERKRN